MSVVPDPGVVRVLLQLAEGLPGRGGWVRLDGVVPMGADAAEDRAAARGHLAELVRLGYCVPPGTGELVYVTRTGMRLARAARQALESGVPEQDLSLATVARHLIGAPYGW